MQLTEKVLSRNNCRYKSVIELKVCIETVYSNPAINKT